MDQKRERWNWYTVPDKYSNEDKKKVLKEVIRIMVETTFSHHHYKWGNKLFRQGKGGSIGLRATGSVSRCIMDVWIEELERKMTENGMEVHMMRKYVDDVVLVTTKLKLGSRYKGGVVTVDQEDVESDVQEGKTEEQVTFEVQTPSLTF